MFSQSSEMMFHSQRFGKFLPTLNRTIGGWCREKGQDLSFNIFFSLLLKGVVLTLKNCKTTWFLPPSPTRSSEKKKYITLKVEEKNTSCSLLYQRIGDIWVSNILLRSSCTNLNTDNEECLCFNGFDTSFCPHPFRNNKFLKCEYPCPNQTFSAYHFLCCRSNICFS